MSWSCYSAGELHNWYRRLTGASSLRGVITIPFNAMWNPPSIFVLHCSQLWITLIQFHSEPLGHFTNIRTIVSAGYATQKLRHLSETPRRSQLFRPGEWDGKVPAHSHHTISLPGLAIYEAVKPHAVSHETTARMVWGMLNPVKSKKNYFYGSIQREE